MEIAIVFGGEKLNNRPFLFLNWGNSLTNDCDGNWKYLLISPILPLMQNALSFTDAVTSLQPITQGISLARF